jgi:hypothetical protein
MSYVSEKESGGITKLMQTKVRWLQDVPFIRNHVYAAIEQHVKEGGENPTLVAFNVIGKPRADIFAESHDRSYETFKKELNVLVSVHLCTIYGAENVEMERDERGRAIHFKVDPTQWPTLNGWVNSTAHIRLNQAT